MDYGDDDIGIHAAMGVLATCVVGMAVMKKRKTKPKKCNRTCWVKPWRETRYLEGNIQMLLKEYKLSSDNASFKSYILMDEQCFHDLQTFVEDDIKRRDTHLRKAIPVAEKLAATLRFLATGETFKELAENTKLSRAYLQASVMETCEAIYRNLQPAFLQFPQSTKDWLKIASEFEQKWQFPLCLGALDGRHIAFTPAKERQNLFYNYKGFHSIVLLALADAFGKFIYVNVGCNGRISDGGVLQRSDLNEVIQNSKNHFPRPTLVGDNRVLPYVIVADNAFPNSPNIMTPFSRSNLSEDAVIFNARLSRARQCVERAFGMLANRFRVLQTKIQMTEDKASDIVLACCVLHNFLINRSPWYADNVLALDENMNVESEEQLEIPPVDKNSNTIRNTFKEYFYYEGKM